MKHFKQLSLYGKNLRSYLLRNQFQKVVNNRGEIFFQDEDFLKGMQSLPPLRPYPDRNTSPNILACLHDAFRIHERNVCSRTCGVCVRSSACVR